MSSFRTGSRHGRSESQVSRAARAWWEGAGFPRVDPPRERRPQTNPPQPLAS